MAEEVYTVREFCDLEKCSPSWLYGEWRANRGPDYIQHGIRRKITSAQREEYHRRLEAEATAHRNGGGE